MQTALFGAMAQTANAATVEEATADLNAFPAVVIVRLRNMTASPQKEERVSLDDIARQAQPTLLHPQHGAHHHG